MKILRTSVALTLVSLALHQSAMASERNLVIVGLGGDEQYREQFEKAASQLGSGGAWDSAAGSAGLAEPDTQSGDVTNTLLLGESVTREGILDALQQAVDELTEKDQFVLTLIGHGSFDGEQYRFNIKGPDITDSELAMALEPMQASRQLIVIATSASGAALQALEAPGRVLITATKSGGEINAVTFPTYWSEALSLDVADVDHNELLTAREAFNYANQQVEFHYSTENLMATEHARLSGDEHADIVLARLGSLRGHENNPAVMTLLAQRADLELKFNAVKARKADLTSSQYFDELEQVLLEIARLQQQIDRETGWSAENG